MSRPWFHSESIPAVGTVVTLSDDEARHARGARRLRAGDAIVLFDGLGHTAEAVLVDPPGTRRPSVRVIEIADPPRPALRLHLASALPKGERQTTLLSMLTQLGAASFTPLTCEHSVARPGSGAHARWTRVAIAACKQSQNPWLPELRPAETPANAAARLAGLGPCFIVHPGNAPQMGKLTASAALATSGHLSVLVGPEGGFNESEVADCEAQGAVRAGLGPNILRTETAGIAALAVLAAAAASEPDVA